MKGRTLLYGMMIGAMLFLNGCQKTPEQTVIVKKDAGVLEKVAKPKLSEGETQTILEDRHWQEAEKKGDNIQIQVDLNLPKIEVSNLPVIEMENKEIADEVLTKLSSRFLKES